MKSKQSSEEQSFTLAFYALILTLLSKQNSFLFHSICFFAIGKIYIYLSHGEDHKRMD